MKQVTAEHLTNNRQHNSDESRVKRHIARHSQNMTSDVEMQLVTHLYRDAPYHEPDIIVLTNRCHMTKKKKKKVHSSTTAYVGIFVRSTKKMMQSPLLLTASRCSICEHCYQQCFYISNTLRNMDPFQ